ncbi:transglutaminase family protein [Pseudomonas sp. RIT-PI-AD]|uniref:SirB1 family protein n=1 Tax=Pseudomonas sp. RIT-PI-AD TaxID=3035294 RepID=UPI0021D8850C|nr:transglutaminase family protein [Pseudomonas sp. RIT-PI-AD]
MNPRQACLDRLALSPAAPFEAALWVAAEHDPRLQPAQALRDIAGLSQQVLAGLPEKPPAELAQPLLRRLSDLDFREDDDLPLRPRAALLHQVLARRRGQPLSLALIALEVARRLDIPLAGVGFPGYFLLRVPGADHLLDPCGGRRLYTGDCRELLLRQLGPQAQLHVSHLQPVGATQMLQRLSRNLRTLYLHAGDCLEALKDAERVVQLGQPNLLDHLSRADIYRHLDCPQAERFDLEHALLLCEDPAQRLQLSQRLHRLGTAPALH